MWKTVENGLEVAEKEQHQLALCGGIDEDKESVVGGGDAGMEYTHQGVGPDNESKDTLLIAHISMSGLRYQDANQVMPYGSLGLCSPSIGVPAYTDEGGLVVR